MALNLLVPMMNSSGRKKDSATACFFCKNQGHWSRDCPFKNASKSQSSISSASPTTATFPVLSCRCGAGTCFIFSSKAPRHANRKYYMCPAKDPRENCEFIQWCDEVKAPICSCGAGRCSINIDSDAGRKYFACRVKKGHGACPFFQWVDSYAEDNLSVADAETFNETVPDSMEIESCPELASIHQELEMEELLLYEKPNLNEELLHKSSPLQIDKLCEETKSVDESMNPESVDEDVDAEYLIPERDDFDTEGTKLLGVNVMSDRSSFLVSSSTSNAVIHYRQQEFMKQIYAAGYGFTEVASADKMNLVLGIQIFGWLGCLVFRPPRFLTAPRMASFSDSFSVSDLNGSFLAAKQSLCSTPRESPSRKRKSLLSAQSPCVRSNSSAVENSSTISIEENVYAKILKNSVTNIQNEFISRLDSIDPHDLEEEANKCFVVLKLIPLERPNKFKNRVMDYIHAASAVTRIDADPTILELVDHHSREKKRFEEVSGLHCEKSQAYKASEHRVRELKEMLCKIEIDIAESEEASREMERCLVEMNQQVKKAKRSMEMAARDVEEVRRTREVERAAAVEALDEARALLGVQ